MYLTHNECKSVEAERFRKTLKVKIYKAMTVNDSKSYISFLNRLVDQYNNICHSSIGKTPIDGNYSALTTDIESSHRAPKFKVGNGVRITRNKNIFSKGYTIIWSREKFVIDSVSKTNP